jgi:hypothetical protein
MSRKLKFVNSCPTEVFLINKKTNKIEITPNGLVFSYLKRRNVLSVVNVKEVSTAWV